METLVLENEYEIVMPLFGAAFAAPNKGPTIILILISINIVKFYRTQKNSRTFQGLWVIFQYFSWQI